MALQRWFVALAVLAMAGAWPARGVSEDRPRPPNRMALPAVPASPARLKLTEREIQSYVAEVVPHIERIAGRKFKAIPPIVVDDAEAAARIFAEDLEPTVRKANLQFTEAQVSEAALTEAQQRMPEIVGKYGLKAKKLAILPANLGPTIAHYHINPKLAPAIMRLLIAHELTHALQAENVDLLKLLTENGTEDGTSACTAVIEGHAMFVQERVGQAMKLDKAASEYNRIFSLGGVDPEDSETRDLAVYQEFTYLAGKRFIEYHYEKGGAERLWEILAHPPLATSVISRPATYTASPPKRPQLDTAFAAVRTELSDQWTVQDHDLGEIHMRAIYADSETSALEEFTAGIVIARTFSAQSQDGGELQLLLFATQDQKARARSFAFLSEEIAKELKAQREEGFGRVKESGEAKWSDVPCDAGRSYALVLVDANGREVLDKRVVLVARGNVVLQFAAADYAIPKAKLAKLVGAIVGAAEDAASAGK